MRNAIVGAAFLCTAAAALVPAGQPAPAASARTWIGREAAIERHLEQARVTRVEDIGTGVTRPRRAWLDPAAPVASMTWKVLPPGRPSGYWESYKSEIAAYRLDVLLAMQMVPPAIAREVDGETGAAIMWIDGVRSVKQTGGKVPAGPEWGHAVRRMQMFDNLIGNPDRNAGNILLGARGELILIDHSRAFITDERLPFPFERVDATLWTRITSLTRETLAARLGPWLDDDAIDAMLKRRARMIETVDKLVRKRGRAAVIIP
jgi:hypothetical protein